MAKQRISSNVSSELATQVRRTAKKAGLSVSAFIEKAVEGLLGRSCLLVENSRLSKELEQKDDCINELNLEKERLSRQITGLQSERDVIKAHYENELKGIAESLGIKNVEDLRAGEVRAKIEVLTESHDIYKAASEERAEQLEASKAQVKALLDRGWWARVWNRVPTGE